MPRTLSTNLTTILSGAEREIDYTLDLDFPDSTTLKFATSPLNIAAGIYPNDLENVSEILQTLESATDSVSVSIQNKDRAAGLNLAANWQKWQQAEAVIGRYYRQLANGEPTGVNEWIEMFRGTVQRPEADDLRVSFDIVADTIAPGGIVCSRTLAQQCEFVFKDAKTCAYAGGETECNHHLTAKLGCDGKGNAHHFGGMQHRYPPDQDIPGTGGNTGGGIRPSCPRLDQYCLIDGGGGKPRTAMVGFLRATDLLFDPIAKEFNRIKSLELFENVEIFEFIAANGAVCYSSRSHKAIRNDSDRDGLAVSKFKPGDAVLTTAGHETAASKMLLGSRAGRGDVLKIELETGHIYCAGDTAEKMIVAHNAKSPFDLD
ncbi:MAG: hypothetical protein KIS76_03810 [Pyrinomonadaceae bacterium]|nr:hypothetical protein [Pyrinomonadaceae bacterium]